MPLVTLKDHGDLRIPVEIRRQIGLGDGDRLSVEIRGDEIVLVPLPRTVPLGSLVGKYAGHFRRHGPITKDTVADAVVEDVLA